MIYFIVTHNNNPTYTNILDIQKRIFDHFNIRYIEGREIEGGSPKLTECINESWNIDFRFPPTQTWEGLFDYFELTMWRWLYPAISKILNDDDIIIIHDADMIYPRPDVLIDRIMNDFRYGKVECQYSYVNNPKHKFRAVPQAFEVKTIRKLFKDKCILDCVVEAQNLRSTQYPRTKKLFEEVYMGYLIRSNDMLNWVNWNAELDQLTCLGIMSELGVDCDNIKDNTEIHGHHNESLNGQYCALIRRKLNLYYQRESIRLLL